MRTPEQIAKKYGVKVGEWQEVTTASWTLEKCRSDVAAKLRTWAKDVVLDGGAPGRVRITRSAGLGTAVKVAYGKVDLIKFKLETQDKTVVSGVLNDIADDIVKGDYDKQLMAGYEKTKSQLKK